MEEGGGGGLARVGRGYFYCQGCWQLVEEAQRWLAAPLPEGWEQAFDSFQFKIKYTNLVTEEVQWHPNRPTESALRGPGDAAKRAPTAPKQKRMPPDMARRHAAAMRYYHGFASDADYGVLKVTRDVPPDETWAKPTAVYGNRLYFGNDVDPNSGGGL